jgi:8-oxo-dGTP pyrophosphatase MutT (NUDIX family)
MKTVIKQRLKQALARRQKHHIVDTSRISSAVLVPIFEKYGEWHILFTKRTERLRDHKGQISFPGGAYEEQDGSSINTALRECAEEIGLSAKAVEVLGELDDMYTLGTYYVISPFVAVISWPYPFKLDPIEVERIIEVPISALLNKDCLTEETDTLNGKPITTYFYHYRGDIIWGATARILNQFLDIWVGVAEDNVK